MKKIIGKKELIALCNKALKLPYEKRSNRDSCSAQKNIATLRMLLLAGCEFRIVRKGDSPYLCSDEDTIRVDVKYTPREDGEKRDTFYLPTIKRLNDRKGEDWY